MAGGASFPPMGVGGTHDAGFEYAVVAINAHQRLYDKDHETQVVFRIFACCMQQHARVGGQAPVVMLARTVDSGERLFVQEGTETVFASHTFHERDE